MQIERGMALDVNLDPTRGSETGKVRPCIVVTNDAYNRRVPVIQVVPIAAWSERKARTVTMGQRPGRAGRSSRWAGFGCGTESGFGSARFSGSSNPILPAAGLPNCRVSVPTDCVGLDRCRECRIAVGLRPRP